MTHQEITEQYHREQYSKYGFWDFALAATGFVIIAGLLACEALAAILSFTSFHIPLD